MKITANRFRFRAWYPSEKHMDTAFHIFAGSGQGCYYGATDCFLPLLDSRGDNCILMQSTGLSDKNGKEIFEGDILQGDFNDSYYERAEVMWDRDESRFRFKSLTGAAWEPRIVDGQVLNMRVIGNIHESQQLLQEKIGIV